MSFVERLDLLIAEKGISRHKFCSKMGIGKNSVASWEIRGNTPDGEVLKKIANYFDVTVDYLLCRTDNPNPDETNKEHLVSVSEQDAQKVYDKLVEVGILKLGEKLTEQHLQILEDVLGSQADYIRFKLDNSK